MALLMQVFFTKLLMVFFSVSHKFTEVLKYEHFFSTEYISQALCPVAL